MRRTESQGRRTAQPTAYPSPSRQGVAMDEGQAPGGCAVPGGYSLPRRTDLLPHVQLPARPGLLLLAMLLLLGLCAILANWNVKSPAKHAGNVLPEDYSCSNLNNTSADRRVSLSAAPAESVVDNARSGGFCA